MKRLSLLMALLPLLLGACSSFEEENHALVIPATHDLQAAFGDDTRTYVESGKYLRWHEADLITAFFGNTLNRQYKFKGKTGDNSGTFSLVPSGELGTGNELDAIYALYPYDENATITDEGVISLSLPATQSYAENSFGKGANTMIAVTESVEDTFLSFKNACGYLKLKLYGDATLASIEVKGNNEEKIAGTATATMEFGGVPSLTMGEDATTAVTLDCGEGVTLGATEDAATEFWIVLPATTFEDGITITATNTDGGVFEKSTTNEVIIARNTIQPMAALGAEFAASKPANNEIWYTNGSTTSKTTPYYTYTYVFGANIESNTYDAEKECWVITFDADVTSIGRDAFCNCSRLTSVTIPDSVTSIGSSAFSGCSSLTSVTIPDSVTSIGSGAFELCSSLTAFYGKFASSDNRALIVDNCIIAYANASGTSYTIPDRVTSIGEGAFEFCSSLTSVTIPDSVTSIGESAFDYCRSLTSVTIPNSVTSIGDSAFLGCSSLTSVTIGDSVTSIGDWAFGYCSSLTSVTIPNSVTSIGNRAFYNCSSLTAFYGKFASADNRCLIIDGVLNSFAPSGLTSYTIPDSVTSIGESAFDYCRSLTSVTIGNSVTSIGYQAFRDCSSLTSVTIPDSVTSIGEMAFDYCRSLTSVTIPDSVTSIGSSAFEDCSSLTTVTIGDSVTSIGYYAFFNCSSLTSVYCKPTTPPTGGYLMFHYTNNDYYPIGCTIYVPTASVSAYKAKQYWSDYWSYIVGYDF